MDYPIIPEDNSVIENEVRKEVVELVLQIPDLQTLKININHSNDLSV